MSIMQKLEFEHALKIAVFARCPEAATEVQSPLAGAFPWERLTAAIDLDDVVGTIRAAFLNQAPDACAMLEAPLAGSDPWGALARAIEAGAL